MNNLLTTIVNSLKKRYNCIILLKGLITIIPVLKNHEYEATIEALSSEGSGIAKIDGYTLFIPGAVPGDRVRLLVLKTKTSYGYAKILEILSPSKDRISPPCAHFQKCGGCQLMTLSYSSQLDFKKQVVKDALSRIGGINIDCNIIGMENPTRYRNKMVFPFAADGSWGFYRERSHEVVPLDDCLLGDSLNTQIMNIISEFIKKHNISVYDEATKKGIFRRGFIRSASDKFMVIISVTTEKIPHIDELIDSLTSHSDQIVSIILNINKKSTNLVLGDKNITLWGKDRLPATLCGLAYNISPHSFFQVNPTQTEKLYQTALGYAALSEKDTLLDVYCGIGTITLSGAKYAKTAVGVEIVPQAIEDAKKNAKRNEITNSEFYCAAAEDIVPKLIDEGISPDVVILDPPRKGSDEKTLSAILKAQPKRIVYVSCNPATLARDAKFLTERGYLAEKATAVDMFPYTTHVETVLLFNKTE